LFGASLALTGAIAATAFVKAFGITFLGMPRSDMAKCAHESSITMTSAMALLAIICLLLGLFPNYIISFLSLPVFSLTGGTVTPFVKGSVILTTGALSTVAIAVSLLITMISALVLLKLFFRKSQIEYGDSWDCGLLALNARMQYTATAFTKPLKVIFKKVYMPKREVSITYSVDKLFVSSMRYSGEVLPFLTKYLLNPLYNGINNVSNKLKFMQAGSLQLYLAYILVTLITLLVFGL